MTLTVCSIGHVIAVKQKDNECVHHSIVNSSLSSQIPARRRHHGNNRLTWWTVKKMPVMTTFGRKANWKFVDGRRIILDRIILATDNQTTEREMLRATRESFLLLLLSQPTMNSSWAMEPNERQVLWWELSRLRRLLYAVCTFISCSMASSACAPLLMSLNWSSDWASVSFLDLLTRLFVQPLWLLWLYGSICLWQKTRGQWEANERKEMQLSATTAQMYLAAIFVAVITTIPGSFLHFVHHSLRHSLLLSSLCSSISQSLHPPPAPPYLSLCLDASMLRFHQTQHRRVSLRLHSSLSFPEDKPRKSS